MNEAKVGGSNFFGTLYADPARLRQFLSAMTGLSIASALAIVRGPSIGAADAVCRSATTAAGSWITWHRVGRLAKDFGLDLDDPQKRLWLWLHLTTMDLMSQTTLRTRRHDGGDAP